MRAVIAVLMSCALAFAPAGALAEEHAEDRSYDVTVSEDRAEITIPREVQERSAESSVVFDTREGLLQAGFGFAEADQTDARLDLQLHQVVEFVDEDDDGQLDDEDEIASAWKLSNASKNLTAESNGTVQWQALEHSNTTSDDDVEGTLVQGVADFPEQDPIAGVISQLGQGENRTFTVNVTVYDGAAEHDGTNVPASSVHVDWTVENYPYTRDDTQLALVTAPNGTGTFSADEADEHSKLATHSSREELDVEVAANLSNQADVDGNETDVHTAMLETDEEIDADGVLSLAYERGTTIEHGMLLGSEASVASESVIESGSDTISEVPALGAASAVGLLATLALALRRR